MKPLGIALCILLGATCSAFADGPLGPPVYCPHLQNQIVPERVCSNALIEQTAYAERKAAKLAREKAEKEQAEADYIAAEERRQRVNREREAAAQVQMDIEAQRQKDFEQQRKQEDAARAKEDAEYARQQAIAAKKQQALLRDRKAECGADFGELRVGMTLARAQHCVGSFKLVGQIAGPNGPVSQYRGPGYTMLNVQRGVIVHWLRP